MVWRSPTVWWVALAAFGKQSKDVSNSVHQRLQILGRGTNNDPPTHGRMDIRPSCAATSWYNGEVFCVALWIHLNPREWFHPIKGLMLMHKENDIYERIGWFESSTEHFDGIPLQTITII